MIDVSIIIVNWNTKQLVLDCIRTIREKIHKTYEIIVVDNASTDGSQEAIKKKFKDIIIIENKENLGFSKANNIGIKISRGKYIAFVNSDVVLINNVLDLIINFLDKNENVGIIAPKIFNEDLSLQPNCREFPTLWMHFCQAFFLHRILPKLKIIKHSFLTNFDYNKIHFVQVVSGAFFITRKVIIDKCGGLDEEFYFYGEDVEFCKRIYDDGWDIIFYPEAQIIHYGGASSSKDPVKYWIKLFNAYFLYFKKQKKSIFLLFIIKIFHVLIRLIILNIKKITKKINSKELIKLKAQMEIFKYLISLKIFKE